MGGDGIALVNAHQNAICMDENNDRLRSGVWRAEMTLPDRANCRPSPVGLKQQMATPEGLEPPTSALGKPCSIRLSYGATRAVPSGLRPAP